MTGQIADEFLYKDEVYLIVGYNGEPLISPQDFGITPQPASTACWRGYFRRFTIKEGKLILKHMDVNAEEAHSINGIEPEKSSEWAFKYGYYDLDLDVEASCKILIARDFIDSMYIHMGFQRPMAFRKVLELTFQEGTLTSVKDMSEEMERLRQQDPNADAEPRSPMEEDVSGWIEKTFSLRYED